MSYLAQGVCRHCGCRQDAPCRACQLLFDGVCFTDRKRTVCAASECQRKEADRVRQLPPARPHRRTPAEITELIKQEQAARRKVSRDRSKRKKPRAA
jgi:hypothetical protein